MSELFVTVFDTPSGAAQLKAELAKLRSAGQLETRESNLVTRDADGQLHLHHPTNIPLWQAVGGGVWGLLLGAVFLSPVAGAAVGAGVGALAGRERGAGIDPAFLEQIGETLQPGGSALCLWIDHVDEAALMDAAAKLGTGGTVIRSPLGTSQEARLQEMLDQSQAG
jgi:uncharacterized membrane protein